MRCFSPPTVAPLRLLHNETHCDFFRWWGHGDPRRNRKLLPFPVFCSNSHVSSLPGVQSVFLWQRGKLLEGQETTPLEVGCISCVLLKFTGVKPARCFQSLLFPCSRQGNYLMARKPIPVRKCLFRWNRKKSSFCAHFQTCDQKIPFLWRKNGKQSFWNIFNQWYTRCLSHFSVVPVLHEVCRMMGIGQPVTNDNFWTSLDHQEHFCGQTSLIAETWLQTSKLLLKQLPHRPWTDTDSS